MNEKVKKAGAISILSAMLLGSPSAVQAFIRIQEKVQANRESIIKIETTQTFSRSDLLEMKDDIKEMKRMLMENLK